MKLLKGGGVGKGRSKRKRRSSAQYWGKGEKRKKETPQARG
jgi:hypothetical protein